LASAQRDTRRLEREGVAWATAVARMMRGAIAAARGQLDDAVEILGEAEPLLEASGLAAQLAALRWMRGRVVGGDLGRQLTAAATKYFEAEGVRSPERFAAFYMPGFAR
jgi:hypothetical protein